MGSVQLLLGPRRKENRSRGILSICAVLAISALCAPRADASFIGYYQLGNFSLLNVDADGFATSPDGGATVLLTGGNDGSGLSGTTDLTISANAAGLVAFTLLYSSFDFPGFDYAGYILGQTFLQFADTDGQSATISFPVTAGQVFGFRVGTFDNTGEPGILAITDFTAPSGATAIPEPGTLALMLAAAAILSGLKLSRASLRQKE